VYAEGIMLHPEPEKSVYENWCFAILYLNLYHTKIGDLNSHTGLVAGFNFVI
jgi:hypothetical protein